MRIHHTPFAFPLIAISFSLPKAATTPVSAATMPLRSSLKSTEKHLPDGKSYGSGRCPRSGSIRHS